MARFLLGLLCAGVMFWAYDRWMVGDAAASGDGTANDGSNASLIERAGGGAGDPDDPDRPVAHEALRGAPQPERFLNSTLEEFLEAVDAGQTEARDSAWEFVRRSNGAGRSELASGLLERIRAAATPAAALELLGRRNSFLHTAEGREAAGLVLARIGEVDDTQKVALGTGLLEVCMRGTLTSEDSAAKRVVDAIYDEHKKAVYRHVFNPSNLTRAQRHVVESGDALSRIAGRYSRAGNKVDAGTLALVNRIHNVNALKVGQVLKIPQDPLHTVMEKGTFLMAMYLGPDLIRLYWVGHGKDSYTPETTFTVGEKLKDPHWYAPNGDVYPHGDPKNILGGYFIQFLHEAHTGFGAHGTPLQDTIGTESSMGCIRMRAADIEDFFRIVPRGSKVEVRNTR